MNRNSERIVIRIRIFYRRVFSSVIEGRRRGGSISFIMREAPTLAGTSSEWPRGLASAGHRGNRLRGECENQYGTVGIDGGGGHRLDIVQGCLAGYLLYPSSRVDRQWNAGI